MDEVQLRRDLRRDEGVRLKPYYCTAGKLSIGAGRNLDDAGITEAEAVILLENDIAKVKLRLDQSVPFWRTLPEPAARGLCNMCYQLGIGGLLKFKQTLALLEIGDYNSAADEALNSLWAKQCPERAMRVTDLFRLSVKNP